MIVVGRISRVCVLGLLSACSVRFGEGLGESDPTDRAGEDDTAILDTDISDSNDVDSNAGTQGIPDSAGEGPQSDESSSKLETSATGGGDQENGADTHEAESTTSGADSGTSDNDDTESQGDISDSEAATDSDATASETTANQETGPDDGSGGSEQSSADATDEDTDLSESDSGADLRLTLADGGVSPKVGGPEGAFHFESPCPGGQLLVGLEGVVKPELRRLRGYCATVEYLPGEPELQLGEAQALDWKGNAVGEVQQRLCPANTAVSGFSGSADRWVGSIALHCAPLQVMNSTEGWQVVAGDATPLAELGSSNLPDFADLACPDGAIAAGIEGDVAISLDTFRVSCRSLALE